jgi:molecular chaperone DnaK (HSP70)
VFRLIKTTGKKQTLTITDSMEKMMDFERKNAFHYAEDIVNDMNFPDGIDSDEFKTILAKAYEMLDELKGSDESSKFQELIDEISKALETNALDSLEELDDKLTELLYELEK